MPATALPPISVDEELATPQMRDPSSNRPKKTRYVHYAVISVREHLAVNL
jgi:hypothetical protein